MDWNESWITAGGIAGVDAPEGIDPRENNDTLVYLLLGGYKSSEEAGTR